MHHSRIVVVLASAVLFTLAAVVSAQSLNGMPTVSVSGACTASVGKTGNTAYGVTINIMGQQGATWSGCSVRVAASASSGSCVTELLGAFSGKIHLPIDKMSSNNIDISFSSNNNLDGNRDDFGSQKWTMYLNNQRFYWEIGPEKVWHSRCGASATSAIDLSFKSNQPNVVWTMDPIELTMNVISCQSGAGAGQASLDAGPTYNGQYNNGPGPNSNGGGNGGSNGGGNNNWGNGGGSNPSNGGGSNPSNGGGSNPSNGGGNGNWNNGGGSQGGNAGGGNYNGGGANDGNNWSNGGGSNPPNGGGGGSNGGGANYNSNGGGGGNNYNGNGGGGGANGGGGNYNSNGGGSNAQGAGGNDSNGDSGSGGGMTAFMVILILAVVGILLVLAFLMRRQRQMDQSSSMMNKQASYNNRQQQYA